MIRQLGHNLKSLSFSSPFKKVIGTEFNFQSLDLPLSIYNIYTVYYLKSPLLIQLSCQLTH